MLRLPTLIFTCIVFFSLTATAQVVPNGGFENWTLSEPDGWSTGNDVPISLFPVTQSGDAHGGSFSLKGTIVLIPETSVPMSAVIQSGAGGNGFPVSERYAVVTGYYKCSLLSGDKFALNFGMFSGGNGIGIGAEAITSNASAWTPFSVPIGYFASGIPDVCILQISIVGPVTGSDYHVGSWYQVDDVALSGTSDVAAGSTPEVTSLAQNFPNPFNPSTTIRYSLAHASYVTLAVFNALGERVATLVQAPENAGSHEVRFDGSRLSSGTYFYRLQAGTYVETKALILVR